ncbi:ABC transporter permease [Anaerolineaceae bacterium oral taxon 439]|nr:ABC transporter permease [Anaerolineaceae bacterium oral taxon 439]
MKIFKSQRVQNMHIPSHIVLVVWSFIVLFPIYIMIINSFKTKFSIYDNPFGLPEKWNLKNYQYVFTNSDFMGYFMNSILVVVISLALTLALGAFAAYALANWKGKASNLVFFFIVAGMMLPIRIASIRLIQIVKALGLLNTIWGLIPIYVAMGFPVSVFIMTAFIRSVPGELTESAFIDGAGRLKIFFVIIMPLLKPAMATVAIYNLVPFWNDLWFPLLFITDEKSKTLLLGVTRLFGQYQTDWSRVLAVLTLSALPVIILYLLMSSQFIKGLTAGAIKG